MTSLKELEACQQLLSTYPEPPQPRQPKKRVFKRVLTGAVGAGLLYIALALFVLPDLPFPGGGYDKLVGREQPATSWHEKRVPIEVLNEIMMATPDVEKIRESSYYYTQAPHLGGKNLTQMEWTRDLWESYGIKSEIVTYDMYANYPKGHRLGMVKASGELIYEAKLEEDVFKEDPTSSHPDKIPTFHGYSASGNVTAEFVYANYGTFADYADLQAAGIDFRGKIVLCRYGGIFRGLKVKRAEELGAIGVVLFTDPGDDNGITELAGYAAYPEGPARAPSSVQRGSVQYLSIQPGDPTTPGYASKPGAHRQDPQHFIPSIPSLPISYEAAIPILKQLNGHGPSAKKFERPQWQTGGLWHKGVDYSIGPAPGIQLNLYNEQEYVTTPFWNVIGKIPGYIKDETVILGNHHDAWIVGGAGDPNSGSAALNEVARSFGKMQEAGWKPARTIMLASWDGEEYGLLGSTEWVEDHAKELANGALAYLNVDVAATSFDFAAGANPLLDGLLHRATAKIVDPESASKGNISATVHDVWSKKIATLGSGSDYTAFQDFLGIPSIDMGFSDYSKTKTVYHYHSNYDSFAWMERFGDPGFRYHVAVAKIWGLIALELSESSVVPFSASNYASGLESYLHKIQSSLSSSADPGLTAALGNLQQTIDSFAAIAKDYDEKAARLAEALSRPQPLWHRILLWYKARKINTGYKLLDRAFCYDKGLDERGWFKHVVYAPGKWTGYAGDTFPGIVENIGDKDWEGARRWVGIVGDAINRAKKTLE
ncbi:peptidase M28 [Pyronema domesticum]|uniref:Similar to Vacuolar protein sorting-associated protein 70 acc. no. P47161 n=1 Tax=Pyronema omphalodes (strain CBS 100304) TaxID=1076935 RepID=U4LF11_PYROM|nr:peptidase M28 [Pyronema domesticum]CCX30709.1 Similar to Vacuolar protein sorting-associated protein 70; acc. no. P47161 [Pyronema omphalodes CBS 100304]